MVRAHAASAAVVHANRRSREGREGSVADAHAHAGVRHRESIKRHQSVWRGETTETVHNRLVKCRGFPLAAKCLFGKPEDATMEDVQELFTFLKAIDWWLEVEVVLMYLRDIFNCRSEQLEPFRLYLEDTAEDGCVHAEQFHGVVTGSGRELLVELSELRERGEVVGVGRELMVRKIEWRVDRDEAFATLPLTMVYMIIFLCLVVFHLQIFQRQQVERGVQAWVEGSGKDIDGPYLSRYVSDVASWRTWLEQSGLPGILADVRNGTRGISARLAVSNTLLGDAKLEQRHFDGHSRSTWLLNSVAGATHLAANPGALTSAATSAARSFYAAAGWADRSCSEMIMTFATFEKSTKAFVLTKVVLQVGIYGHAHTYVSSAAVRSEPYDGWLGYPFDALYCLLILYILHKELLEMWRSGISGFRDYWSLWNFVDWVSITLGLVSIGLWVSVCFAMSAEELHKFLEDDGSGSRTLKPNIMRISERDLNALVQGLELAHFRFFVLHVVVAANTVSIILRFFKAFQANMRLAIVAQTFASCYQEIVHFLIVLSVIFICMAVIAHTLFGNDVREFHTLGSSFNTCFMVLMGDFGWYVARADTPNFLPSGIPKLLMVIWFFAYMFLVSIVLLNMLLAIILEKYSEVCVAPNERTLWAQTFRFIERMKKSRHEISLVHMLAELEDKNEPAHPDSYVTLDSLKKAFNGMPDKQAESLMGWLQQEVFLQDTIDQGSLEVQRLKRTERTLTRLLDTVQDLARTAQHMDDRLAHIEGAYGYSKADVPQDRSPSKANAAQDLPPPSGLPSSVWKQKQHQLLWCCNPGEGEDDSGTAPMQSVHPEDAHEPVHTGEVYSSLAVPGRR